MQGASGESNLTLSTGGEKEAALASALSGKLHRGGCQMAPKSTLVVSVRMGDVLCDDPRVQKHAPKIMSLVNASKAYINRSGNPPDADPKIEGNRRAGSCNCSTGSKAVLRDLC